MRESRGRNKGAADSLRALARAEQVDQRIADLDVANAESVQQATDSIVKEAGSIDVLVNNAGTLYLGIRRASAAAAAHSGQHRSDCPDDANHIGVELGDGLFLTESSRYELSQLGVDVVLVQPSAFETEMFSKIQAPRDAGRRGEYRDVLKFQETLVSNLGAAISGPNATKPQAVADAIAEL